LKGTDARFYTTTERITTSEQGSAATSTSSPSVGEGIQKGSKIAGAVVGTIAAIILLGFIAVLLFQRHRRRYPRDVTELTDSPILGTSLYEKQIAHYSRTPLPPLPRRSATITALRKKLGLSNTNRPKPHVLEGPQEFAASALGDDVHEGV
jgi:hypothetical protein